VDGDGLILESLAINGYAEGCAGFILPSVTSADCAFLVIKAVEILLQTVVDVYGYFGHAVPFYQRKHAGADMAQGGRRSGIPDCFAFQRLCPNAPGFFNLIPGTWTGAQPLRPLQNNTERGEKQGKPQKKWAVVTALS
jgi:hypothetical protein